MARHARRRFLGLGAALTGISLIWVLALSGSGSAASQAAPTNTTEPRILGTVRVGSTLTANRGLWTGSPTSFRYQWVRCPESGGRPDGSDCTTITGATDQQYVISEQDVDRRIRVRVTATNPDGSTTAASNATRTVPGETTPVNTRPPTVSGTVTAGATLTANAGEWTQRPTFAYQWRRCDANGGSCADIGGSTQRTYVLKTVDVGNTLRVRVTATSGGATTAASSVPTAVIRPAVAPPPTPAPNGCPAGTGMIQADRLSAPARLAIQGQQLSPAVVTGGTRSLSARFRVTACGGRPVQGALLYATAVPFNQFTPRELPTGSDGWATLTMNRLRGYPANPGRQELLVMMVRARKGGENILGGVSTRRLVSFPVNLST